MISTRSAPAAGRRPPSNRRRSLRKALPWLGGAALLGLIVVGLLPKPLAVETAKVGRGPLAVSVLEEGKTRIRHRYTISPPVSGFLQRVELRAGDRIEAGVTVLARVQAEPASLLNPRLQTEAEARVKGAEASINQHQSELDHLRNPDHESYAGK